MGKGDNYNPEEDEILLVGSILGKEPHASEWRAYLGEVKDGREKEPIEDLNTYPEGVKTAICRLFGTKSSNSTPSSSGMVDRNALIAFLSIREAALEAAETQLAHAEGASGMEEKPLNRKSLASLLHRVGVSPRAQRCLHEALDARGMRNSGQCDMSVKAYLEAIRTTSAQRSSPLAPRSGLTTTKHPLVVAHALAGSKAFKDMPLTFSHSDALASDDVAAASGPYHIDKQALVDAWVADSGLTREQAEAIVYLVSPSAEWSEPVQLRALTRLSVGSGFAFRVKSSGGNVQSNNFHPLASTSALYRMVTDRLISKVRGATATNGTPVHSLSKERAGKTTGNPKTKGTKAESTVSKVDSGTVTLSDVVITLDRAAKTALVNSDEVPLCACVAARETLFAWSQQADIALERAAQNPAITHIHPTAPEVGDEKDEENHGKAKAMVPPKTLTAMDVNRMLKPTKTVKL